MAGAELIFGIKAAKVEGADMKEKVKTVGNMDGPAAFKAATEHGFIYKNKVGSAVLIPADHVIVTTNVNDKSKPTHGIKWPLCRTKICAEHAKAKLGTMMAEQVTSLSEEVKNALTEKVFDFVISE